MILIFEFGTIRRLFVLKCTAAARPRSMASIIFGGFRLSKFVPAVVLYIQLLHRMISVKPTERSAFRCRVLYYFL